jgi:hypothetical protein
MREGIDAGLIPSLREPRVVEGRPNRPAGLRRRNWGSRRGGGERSRRRPSRRRPRGLRRKCRDRRRGNHGGRHYRGRGVGRCGGGCGGRCGGGCGAKSDRLDNGGLDRPGGPGDRDDDQRHGRHASRREATAQQIGDAALRTPRTRCGWVPRHPICPRHALARARQEGTQHDTPRLLGNHSKG